MKLASTIISACLLCTSALHAGDLFSNTIVLDETAVKNLHLELAQAEDRNFESTVFCIGRIEEIPASHSVVSSRIKGRVVSVSVFVGDTVELGDTLLEVESRQPGDPPPVIALKAPQSGLVIASHIRLGEPVEPEKELLDISDRSEVWAVARIPEKAAADIHPGTPARIRIPALGDSPMEAQMLRYGVTADRTAGTVEGIFVLPNPDGKLQPGMRAQFSLVTSTRANILAVPRMAVQGDPANRIVFVKDFDIPNAFVRVPVVLGEQNDTYVEVINGLFPGDEVVTHGSYSLSFAGSSSISLKEALDAAHGHEHNEDGSEITPEQKAAALSDANSHPNGSKGNAPLWLKLWAGIATTLFLICLQQLLRARHRADAPPHRDHA